jgi:hypothetical protein
MSCLVAFIFVAVLTVYYSWLYWVQANNQLLLFMDPDIF